LSSTWRFHGLGRLATHSDFSGTPERRSYTRPVLFVVGYRLGAPFQDHSVCSARRFLTSSSAWRWVENEPKRSSPMRTYQPTVVGSTRKIVRIACLPQTSVAQIAQISELPTVRGAPAHSVSYWPRPYVDASPAGTSYDRQDGNRAIERSATPWQRAFCADLAGRTMTRTCVEISLTTPRTQMCRLLRAFHFACVRCSTTFCGGYRHSCLCCRPVVETNDRPSAET